jgi:hypothetical protein
MIEFLMPTDTKIFRERWTSRCPLCRDKLRPVTASLGDGALDDPLRS